MLYGFSNSEIDQFYLLHLITDNLSTKISLDVIYDLRCQTDQLRLTKQSRVCGVAMCPVLENKIALLITDSRLLLWKIQLVEQPHVCQHTYVYLYFYVFRVVVFYVLNPGLMIVEVGEHILYHHDC